LICYIRYWFDGSSFRTKSFVLDKLVKISLKKLCIRATPFQRYAKIF
jgi:hypothetical protein